MSQPKAPIRLLIAEDEDGLRTSLLEYFTALDYDVTAVNDGVKALDLFQKNTFDAILTDIRMPNKTGIDLLVRVQKSKVKTGVGPKVIIMTGLLEAGEDYLKSLGATKVIEKPIRLDELARIIEGTLAEKT